MRILSIILLALVLADAGYSCEAEDANCIYVSSIKARGEGPDNVILCNRCTEDVTLENGVMIVDNNPDNAETLDDTTIPGLGCVTLVEDVDFNFGLSANGDGFTLTCMDGSVIVSVTYGELEEGQTTVFFEDPPQTCNTASASSIYISKVIYSGDAGDQIIVCNSSDFELTLTGILLSDSGNSTILANPTFVPAQGCVSLMRGVHFEFGLGDEETVTIACGDVEFDSVSYDQSEDEDLDCFVAAEAPGGPCDPDNTSIFISSIDTEEDIVIVCNNSSQLVSLDGATLADSGNSESVYGITIPPYGCVQLIRDVHFTFGLGGTDEFSISCEDIEIALEAWDNINGQIVFQNPPIPPIAEIPTLGEWGLVCLSICLLIFGIQGIREMNLAGQMA